MLKAVFNKKINFFCAAVFIVGITGCSSSQFQQATSPQNDQLAAEEHTAGDSVGPDTAAPASLRAAEPEPLSIPQLTKKPLPVTDVWQRARKGFSLNIDYENKRVQAQRRWYAGHQEYLNRVSKRAERYLYHVVDAIEQRDMPLELALLPIVESAYDPFAYSHGRASGMWQFIPGTGKRFGLEQNWWYDGRRDIVASTRAALDYLSYLERRFDGNWLLALAAYNSGEGNVRKAVKRNRAKQRPTDFWSLDLPKETRAYVPKLIALAQIVAKPAQYGVTLPPIGNRPYFAQVEVGSQVDLAQAAELAAISLNELYLLNPGYNQWATAPDGPHRLNVPVANAAQFQANLANLPPEKRISWIRYKIKRGDSLSTIARRHRTTAKALRQVNQLRNNNIRAGNVLFIPVASKGSEHYALSASQRLLAKQQAPAKQGKSKLVHRVRSGDSFWELSRRYGVGMRELARWNGMGTTDRLRIGQKLVIWTKPAVVATTAAPAINREIIRQVGYRVRPGDSLARIAQKFNVSIANIEAWNGINRKKYLQPGQSLTLYVDITRASL